WTSELDRDLAKVVSTALGKRMSRECEKAAETKARNPKPEIKEGDCRTEEDEENNEEGFKDEDAEEQGTEELE
ncbi:unnamed protein product, partial [Symbiodinium microadriaticum]